MPQVPILNRCASDDASFESDLSMLLDGELDESRAGDVRRHLDECAHCSQLLRSFETVDQTLRSVELPAAPRALQLTIWDAIERAKREQPSQPPSRAESDSVAQLPPGRPSRLWRRAAPVLALAASLAIYFALPDPTVDLSEVSEEELALALEFDTIRDLDLIANLELVEQLAEIGAGSS